MDPESHIFLQTFLRSLKRKWIIFMFKAVEFVLKMFEHRKTDSVFCSCETSHIIFGPLKVDFVIFLKTLSVFKLFFCFLSEFSHNSIVFDLKNFFLIQNKYFKLLNSFESFCSFFCEIFHRVELEKRKPFAFSNSLSKRKCLEKILEKRKFQEFQMKSSVLFKFLVQINP